MSQLTNDPIDGAIASPSPETLVTYLIETELFSGFDITDLNNIASTLKWITLTEGQTLFKYGDESDALYMVIDGCLQAAIIEKDKSQKVIGKITPGNPVGEMEVLTGRTRSASVYAIENTHLIKLPRDSFDEFANKNPQLLNQLGKIIQARLQQNHLLDVLPTLFGESLDIITLSNIESKFNWVYLPGGKLLIKEGTVDSHFYILITGRLVAKVANNKGKEETVGELMPGESIGEMQILTGQAASASIYAIRDSQLICFSKENFDWLTTQYPQVMRQITKIIANRLRRVLQGLPQTEAQKSLALDIAIVPISPDVPLQTFIRRLRAELKKYGSTLVLSSKRFDYYLGIPDAVQISDDHPNNIRLITWLNEQESRHQFILYQTDTTVTPWTERSLRQADYILLVGMANSSADLNEIEKTVLANNKTLSNIPKSLVLLYDNKHEKPSNTHNWLAPRQLDGYHHLKLYDDADFKRLARLLTGRGIGLVLGGGGARGYAHIGVIRALHEAEIPIDMVGGTSMGSIIAAQCAMGWNYETMLKRNRAALPSQVLDYTLPISSLITGRNWTTMLTELYGDKQIEDLWLNFFCVSSNITRAETVIHESGPLWKAIRTSTAIPGIIPPMIEKTDLLVDGGLVNNVPIDIMQHRNPGGPIIASDVSAAVDLEIQSQIGPTLSGWTLLWHRLNPFLKPLDIPTIGATLSRTSVLGSVQAISKTKSTVDLYIFPPVEKYNTLGLKSLEAIAKIGYEFTAKKIADLKAEDKLDGLFF